VHGVDIETKDVHGNTALCLAAGFGHDNLCAALLARRANVNTTSGPHGRTALMAVAETGTTRIASLLLKHDASVNARCDYHVTALGRAAGRDFCDIITVLDARECEG
jgi:ankyrin repeat protein